MTCKNKNLGGLDARFSSRDHWLTFDQENRIIGCQCGFTAHEWDCGYGDSVVDHIAFEVSLEALRDIGYPEDSPESPSEIARNIAYGTDEE